MLKQVMTAIRRSDTLAQDVVGAASLMVLLMAGLYLPGL